MKPKDPIWNFYTFLEDDKTISGRYKYYMGQVMRKRVLCHMRTTKVQISLRIRAV